MNTLLIMHNLPQVDNGILCVKDAFNKNAVPEFTKVASIVQQKK